MILFMTRGADEAEETNKFENKIRSRGALLGDTVRVV